jgi:hypothetical protein
LAGAFFFLEVVFLFSGSVSVTQSESKDAKSSVFISVGSVVVSDLVSSFLSFAF